jgi:hypothetical protein
LQLATGAKEQRSGHGAIDNLYEWLSHHRRIIAEARGSDSVAKPIV